MRTTNLEELQASDTLQDVQSGRPLDAFNRSNAIRHAQITSLWEVVFAALSLLIFGSCLASLILRGFGIVW